MIKLMDNKKTRLCILAQFIELYGLYNQSILSKAYNHFGTCAYPILAFIKVILIINKLSSIS